MGNIKQVIRVLVVDDQEIVRLGVAHSLKAIPHISIADAVGSAEEAYEWLEGHQVDVALMDIVMPGQSGIEACKYITEHYPNIKILILSTLEDSRSALQALNAHARGYLTKGCLSSELVQAITAVHHGEHYLQSSITRKLATDNEEFDDVSSPFGELSLREMEIAMLLIDGYSAPAIAEDLDIDISTVHSYRTRIFEKLEVSNSIKLSHLAIKYGEKEISICTNLKQA